LSSGCRRGSNKVIEHNHKQENFGEAEDGHAADRSNWDRGEELRGITDKKEKRAIGRKTTPKNEGNV